MQSETESLTKKRERPLSPHLTIYRPQITSVLSITHRLTGLFIFLGAFVFVWWLVALSQGEDNYKAFLNIWVSSFLGKLFMFSWTFSILFHLFNGIRHLFWDIGRGYSLNAVNYSGIAVIAGSFSYSFIIWMFVAGVIDTSVLLFSSFALFLLLVAWCYINAFLDKKGH